MCWKIPGKLCPDCHVCAIASCFEKSCCDTFASPSRVELLDDDLSKARGDLTAFGTGWKLLPLAQILHCQEAPACCFLGVGWVWQCAACRDARLALSCLSRTLRHRPSYSRDSLSNAFARHGNVASRVAFPVAGLPFLFFFLGGKDIHYTSAMIATSRVCDVHHKPERPKLTTHLELFRHES